VMRQNAEPDGMSSPTRKVALRDLWLIGFGLVAVAQLAFVAFHVSVGALFATWTLAPLLAAWVWRMDGPKLLVLALVFCWVGDVVGNPRQIGIGPGGLLLSVASFAVANVCLITMFVQRGALTALRAAIGGVQRWRAGLTLLYVLGAVAGLFVTWSSLEPALRTAAGIYLLLLVGTAATAMAVDTRAGIGAGLFFASELLIALAIAGRVVATATTHRLEVLVLYMLGILLIAVGVVRRELRAKQMLNSDKDVVQRADR
jgi:hypothetical protein